MKVVGCIMAWEYDVATHTFTHNGERYAADYAGATGYKNNSSQECISGKGPLPRGTYKIGAPHNSAHTGKYTLNLTPVLSSAMCGRSAFRIHGASKRHPLDSSEGCIIAPLGVRKAIWASGDTELKVK
ncbi:tlde1 domain-containing protein [Siccibacter turicensis]|uniref:tlde1 domain-containing protein n=2 Tax=Siccibacter turicensis TaxID=357233 RepID=UPI003CEBA507